MLLANLDDLLADVRVDPSETDEVPRVEAALEAASRFIEDWLDRGSLELGETQVDLPGYGRVRLFLDRLPVLEVLEVQVDGVVVPDDEYTINSKSGELYREKGWPLRPRRASLFTSYDMVQGDERRNVSVTYRAGYSPLDDVVQESPLPQTIQIATRMVAATYWSQLGRDMRVRRGHLLRQGTWFDTAEMDTHLMQLIGRYRRISAG